MIASGGLWRFQVCEKTALAINGAVALASQHAANTQEVAKETGAPLEEADAVLCAFCQAGLAKTNGNGTIAWCRDPHDVSLFDIATAVGEPFDVHCGAKGAPAGERRCTVCPLNDLAGDLKTSVVGLFKTKRLDELLPAVS